MKNTLADLNNYLFEALERLTDDGLTEDQLRQEITRSKAITSVAETVVHNGELALAARRYVDELGEKNAEMPPMLSAGDN